MSKSWQNFFLLLAHIVIGIMSAYFNGVAWVVGLFPLIGGSYSIIRNKNTNNEAIVWAAYSVGAEVFLRMTGANLTYEIGKYTVIFLMLLGLLVERRAFTFGLSLVYIILLLPSIFLIDVEAVENLRSHILFNLSGPICLFMAVWYFNDRVVQTEQAERILVNMLLPIVAMAVLISIKTPDFSQIKFKAGSNFLTSGGFGPNQVATQLGLGILILGYAMMTRIRLFPWISVTVAVLTFLTYRGALTLSRGGILAALASLFLCGIFALVKRRLKFADILKISVVVVAIGFAGNMLWDYVDKVTKGQLYNRYTGRSSEGKFKVDPTSGREAIFKSELQAFTENPITGIGLGMGKLYRKEKLDLAIATHNEFGRMLGEHGLLGAIDILILISILVKAFWMKLKYNPEGLGWMAGFACYALITMGHSALRIALPSYLFGLSIAYLVPAIRSVPSKQSPVKNENIASHGLVGARWSREGSH